MNPGKRTSIVFLSKDKSVSTVIGSESIRSRGQYRWNSKFDKGRGHRLRRVKRIWPRPWKDEIRGRSIGSENLAFLQRPLYSIVSSILPDHGIDQDSWNRYLAQALRETKRDLGVLLVMADSPIAEKICHFAHRMEVDVCRVHIAGSLKTGSRSWVDELRRREVEASNRCPIPNSFSFRRTIDLWIESRADLLGWNDSRNDTFEERSYPAIPDADLLSILLPDRVYVLGLRSGGRIFAALQRRFLNPHYPLGSVRFAADDDLTSNQRAWLHSNGATCWLCPSRDPTSSHRRKNDQHLAPVPCGRILRGKDFFEKEIAEGWNWLTHCTRARKGPWPDQSPTEYFDEQWLGKLDFSPLATLRRIVERGQILATKWYQRSNVATVCFSEVPTFELISRRCYRRHLKRWDWEPYGIGIRKSAAIRMQARPVIYGNACDYEHLDESDRPFFQTISTQLVDHHPTMPPTQASDWRIEREWRIGSDVLLSDFHPEELFLFVPTMTEAESLATLTSFPILVLDDDSSTHGKVDQDGTGEGPIADPFGSRRPSTLDSSLIG